MSCPLCNPEIIYYEDETIKIIKDIKRDGKLIVSKEHIPMTKEGLQSIFEIHCRGAGFKGNGHVSIDHLHLFYK